MPLHNFQRNKHTGYPSPRPVNSGPQEGTPRPSSFRLLFVASIGDGIGDDVLRSMLPLIAVAATGASAFQTSVVNALGMAAFLLLGVPAGVLVDRWPRKSVLVLSNIVRACAALSVPIACFLGGLTLWHLLLVAAVVSVSDVFFTTAQSAAIPLLLKGDELSRGYAKIQSMQSGIAIATPGVVGLVARAVAAPAVLVVAATAYLASAFVTSRLPLAVSSHPARPGKFWVEARAGLGFTWCHPLIRPLMISVALVNAAGMAGAAAKVVYALEVLDIPVDQFVGIGSVSALGGLAASLSTTRITGALGIGKTKITASLASACFVLLLPVAPLLGLSPVVWVGISGLGWSYFVVVSGLAGAGIIPRLASHRLMGRVMATYRLVTLGVMPVAGLAGGALATYLGVTAALWVWALLAVAAAFPIVFSPLRSWMDFPVELDVHTREGEVRSSAPAQ